LGGVSDADMDPRKYRNYVIAASIGGFLLPIVGLVGAFVFFSRGDERSAIIVGIASFAGAIAYGAVFALAGG
jgi:hypothetical protein